MIVPAVLGDADAVAIRVPDHAVARGLSEGLGFPIVSTSANRSGRPAPSAADVAAEEIGDAVDMVIDAGPVAGGEPSTIVDARGDGVRLIRAGAISFALVLEVR